MPGSNALFLGIRGVLVVVENCVGDRLYQRRVPVDVIFLGFFFPDLSWPQLAAQRRPRLVLIGCCRRRGSRILRHKASRRKQKSTTQNCECGNRKKNLEK